MKKESRQISSLSVWLFLRRGPVVDYSDSLFDCQSCLCSWPTTPHQSWKQARFVSVLTLTVPLVWDGAVRVLVFVKDVSVWSPTGRRGRGGEGEGGGGRVRAKAMSHWGHGVAKSLFHAGILVQTGRVSSLPFGFTQEPQGLSLIAVVGGSVQRRGRATC